MRPQRPSSVYLCASLAGMHRVKGEVQEAMALMQRSVSLSQRYPQLHLNQGYNLSDLHWFMGEYERAIPLQRAFLSGTKRDAFRAFCGWKLVFALWMTRSKDTAEMHGLCVNVIEKCACTAHCICACRGVANRSPRQTRRTRRATIAFRRASAASFWPPTVRLACA